MTGNDRKRRLLVVEDEDALRRNLKLNFELEGYHVTTAATGGEALERARSARFDTIVLDVMLPEVDGFSVCESIRLQGDRTPVLFLTARNSAQDRIRGLRTGDDHLAKPFDLEELLLRVEKLVARGQDAPVGKVLEERSFGGNEVDFGSFEIKGQRGLRKVLSQREAMLLRLLMEREGEVVSREEILEKVWGYDVFPTTRTVDNFIVAFRKYFEPDPKEPRHFHSVRGVGYRFSS